MHSSARKMFKLLPRGRTQLSAPQIRAFCSQADLRRRRFKPKGSECWHRHPPHLDSRVGSNAAQPPYLSGDSASEGVGRDGPNGAPSGRSNRENLAEVSRALCPPGGKTKQSPIAPFPPRLRPPSRSKASINRVHPQPHLASHGHVQLERKDMLCIRSRGKSGIYYIRGSVSLGDKRIDVREFSTRTTDFDAASHLMAEHETRLRHQLMFGPAVLVAQGTIADAFDSYLSKAKPPCPSDVLRIGKLRSLIGNFSLREPKQAWEHFRRAYLTGHDPGGQDRYRSVFQAAINVHYDLHDLPPLRIKAIPFNNERVRFLSKEDRDRLIGAYSPHIQPIVTMLAFQGPRVLTALQMQWGVEGADMERGSIRLYHSKNSVIQSVPIHPRVRDVLYPLWEERGRPLKGHVFLNRFRKPYQDTRKAKTPGGNPLKHQHATACERAGIEDFTMHDWRHHWASHCVMAGIDLITIMNMGGWKSLRMVQR